MSNKNKIKPVILFLSVFLLASVYVNCACIAVFASVETIQTASEYDYPPFCIVTPEIFFKDKVKYSFGILISCVFILVITLVALLKREAKRNTEGLLREIDERKKAEEKLFVSKECFRHSLLNAPFPVMIHAEDGEVLRINKVWTELTGYTPEEIPTISAWTEMAHGEKKNVAKNRINKVFNHDARVEEGEYTITSKDGRTLIWDFNSAPLDKLPDGRRLVISMAMDVTDRKIGEDVKIQLSAQTAKAKIERQRAEEIKTAYARLQDVQTRYKTVADFAYNWEWWKGPDGEYLYMSPSCERITGYKQEEFIGRMNLVDEIILPEDRKIWNEHNKDTQNKYEPLEIQFRIKRKDGVVRWIEHVCQPVENDDGDFLGFRASNCDITEQKQAVAKLKDSRQRLIRAGQIARMGFLDWNLKTNKIVWSQEVYKLYGIDQKISPTVERTFDSVHPDDREFVKENLDMAIQGICDYDVDYRIIRSNGEVAWMHARADLQLDEEGVPAFLLGTVVDISDRKIAEAAMQISETNLVKAQEAAHIGSWYLNLPENNLVWTDENYRIFGVPVGTPMTYEKFLKIVHPEDRDRVEKQWIAAVGGEPYDIEHRLLISNEVNNEVKWVREKAELVFDDEGNPKSAVGITQDITAIKRSEEELSQLRSELLHSTRTGTMVELTAALAHELNHPLGSILNNANAAKRFLNSKKPDLDEIRDILADIISEDRRASDVIQKLRALMKKTEVEFTLLNINDVIEDVFKLTRSDLVIKNVSLSTKLEKKLPKINGDRVQLQQVFLNLIINATDAMKKCRKKHLCVSVGKHSSRSIIVCIRDSGAGFDENIKDKLFDPFFTTKNEGMGMGLSVNKTIIGTHNGDIWAENNKEDGSSFFVTLPIDKETQS